MNTRARNYYDAFVAGGSGARGNRARLTRLRALIDAAEPRFEDDWLDYKGGGDVNEYLKATGALQGPTGMPEEKLKKWQSDKKAKLREAWSVIIGQFSNNEGGVVIWGIDSRKINGIDAPGKEVLLEDVGAAENALRDLDGKVTDPPTSGIEHKAVRLSQKSKQGFLVTYIPEGKTKPYRSESAGKQFYIRMGDKGHVPSVSVLKMLYRSGQTYRVKLGLRITHGPGPDRLYCHLRIINEGVSTLREPLLTVTADIPVDSQQPSPFMRYNEHTVYCPLAGNLHCGREQPAAVILWMLERQTSLASLKFVLYAQDSEPMFASTVRSVDLPEEILTLRLEKQGDGVE